MHSFQVPRSRRFFPEAPDLTYDRRLTARPAVLAKRTEPGRHTSRPTVDGPGRTSSSDIARFPSRDSRGSSSPVPLPATSIRLDLTDF